MKFELGRRNKETRGLHVPDVNPKARQERRRGSYWTRSEHRTQEVKLAGSNCKRKEKGNKS